MTRPGRRVRVVARLGLSVGERRLAVLRAKRGTSPHLSFRPPRFDAAVATFLFCVFCPRASRSRRCGNLIAW